MTAGRRLMYICAIDVHDPAQTGHQGEISMPHCRIGRVRDLLVATSLLALASGAINPAMANGADPIRMHRAPHAPLPSTLPPPHFVGDAGTRLHRPYGGTPIDVTTYHYDLDRTGWNQTETDLTPATVAS